MDVGRLAAGGGPLAAQEQQQEQEGGGEEQIEWLAHDGERRGGTWVGVVFVHLAARAVSLLAKCLVFSQWCGLVMSWRKPFQAATEMSIQ